jgi:hypothetical protein
MPCTHQKPEPGFDQLEASLNVISCVQKEAHTNLQPTKITDSFGQPWLQASPARPKQPPIYVEDGSDAYDSDIELLEEGLAPVAVQLHGKE